MTWDRIIATGFGDKTDYRLIIAGSKYIFCTHPDMVQTDADGRERVVGLVRRGLISSQRVNLQKGIAEDGGMTVTITDALPNRYATKAFAWLPSIRTHITSDVAVGGLGVAVNSDDGWSDDDSVFIGAERMQVDGAPAGDVITVDNRGSWDTEAQKHWFADELSKTPSAMVTNRPTGIEGRRAWLYAYGPGDDYTGAGSLAWSGECQSDARRNTDGTYQVLMSSRIRRLAQNMGHDGREPVRPRGIYYSDSSSLAIVVTVWTTDEFPGGGNVELESSDPIFISGHFESQEAFAVSANADIATAVSAMAYPPQSVAIVPVGDDDWFIQIHTATGTARYVTVVADSPMDGLFDSEWISGKARSATIPELTIHTMTADTLYHVIPIAAFDKISQPRSCPRGFFGAPERMCFRYNREDIPYGTNYRQRVYVGGTSVVAGADFAIVNWPAVGDKPELSATHEITASVASDRSIDLGFIPAPHGELDAGNRPYTRSTLPTFAIARQYAIGNIADCVDQIVDDSPTYKSIGGAPDFTDDDIDQSVWDSVIDAADGDSRLLSRRRFWSDIPERMDKFLVPHLQMLGCFLGLDSSGKIIPVRYALPLSTDHDATAIAVGDIKSPAGDAPVWEAHSQGVVHTATLRTGYDPFEDKFKGATLTVIDGDAFSKTPLGQSIEVAPKSTVHHAISEALTSAEAYEMFRAILGMLGHEYAIVRLPLSMKHHGRQLGDVVSITHPRIPDWQTGTIGVTSLAGMVVGVERDYERLVCTLDVFVTGLRVAGYAPSLGVLTQTNTGGNDWTVACAFSDPLSISTWKDGDVLSDHYSVGDGVRLIRFNDTTAGRVSAEVKAIDDVNEYLYVTTSATWTPGSAPVHWVVEYAEADSGNITSTQDDYAFWAGVDRRISHDTVIDAWNYSV